MTVQTAIHPGAPLSDADRKILERIRHFIETPPEQSRIFDLRPNVCAALLEEFNNVPGKPNRPKKPAKIKLYADDMLADEWALTGDTIKFGAARLLDGQNRMMASVQSGKGFRSHIVFGIDEEFFDRMDRGKPRDASDILALHGYANSKHLAGALRWAHLVDTGRVKQRDTLEPKEQARLVQQRYPTLPDFIAPARAIYSVTKQPISIVAGLLFWFDKSDARDCDDFATAWAGGRWSGRYNPIRVMTAEITRLHQVSNGRVHDAVRAALIVVAWNLFRANRKGNKSDFAWSQADDFPTIA